MKKERNIALYFLISIIAVLFVSMLVLCGLYLDLRINGISSSLPDIPEKDKWILTETANDPGISTEFLITTSFIGFKTKENGMIAAIPDYSPRKSLITRLDKCLPELFSGKGEHINFKNEAEKEEFIKSVTNSESFFYVAYYGEIPSAAILPSANIDNSMLMVTENFYIQYMFILPDPDDNMYAVCFDKDMEAVVLTPEKSIAYSENNFFAYNGVSGFVEFEFVSDLYPEPLYTESFDANSVMMVPSSSFYDFKLYEDSTKQLLKVLGFNTNMVKTFRSGDNTTATFVDEGKELYVSIKNSTISYNGYDSGIHMSDILKYEPQNDGYTFSDTVLCVKYLIGLLDRVIVGGDASATLVGIRKDKDGIYFDLKYFYNGIMLNENASDITVRIKGDYIKDIDINAVFCVGGAFKKPVIPQKLAMTVLGEEGSGNVRYNAAFSDSGETSSYELVWIARREVEEHVS